MILKISEFCEQLIYSLRLLYDLNIFIICIYRIIINFSLKYSIFIFILIVSIGLGYILSVAGTEENLAKYCLINSPVQPVIASFIGLIPNCAISVLLTLLYLKHTISFGSLIAGLSSSSGLGLLILLTRNNDKKDTAVIIAVLIVISSVTGILIQNNIFNINYIFQILGIKV